MEFEFDPAKSASNQIKHGIDFEAAQELWGDPGLVEAPARVADEPRFLVVGKIGAAHWSAICVRRGDSLRIISVRRARRKEIANYESV